MRALVRKTYFITIISFCNINYSIADNPKSFDLSALSCHELMLELINDSSFKNTFQNKNLPLAFYFERTNETHIGLTFIKIAGADKNGVYANFDLNLEQKTLNIIDPEIPISIKINTSYISYISEKCTPDKNIYRKTGRLPDPEIDG